MTPSGGRDPRAAAAAGATAGSLPGPHAIRTRIRCAGLAAAFDAHCRTPSSDKYHVIRRYLLGMTSRDDLRALARAPRDRCEFAYYIGFSERLEGNYGEAAQWYQLCRETLFNKNGEFAFASDELLLWACLEIESRHRLVKDDVAERDKARRRYVKGLAVMEAGGA